MKIPLAVLAALSLLLSLSALGQTTAAPPPIRMGLWQYEVTMSGGPGPAAGPRTIITQSCVTPETWTQSFRSSRQQAQECTTTNLHQSEHELSFDVACSQQNMTSNTHVQMSLDSESEMHGTVETQISGPNFPGMTMTSQVHSKFLSTDCGDVQPGHPRMVTNQ